MGKNGGINMIQTNKLNIRNMSESDYSYMVKWLNDDLILEYYGPRLTMAEVMSKYGPRINNEHYVRPCIVENKGEPIGYMQYYKIPNEQFEKYGYTQEESIYGMDQFIGVPDLWGKGIGTQMINALLKFLNSEMDVDKVVLDVKCTNLRAIKVYEKCGFRIVKDLEDNYFLMEWVKS